MPSAWLVMLIAFLCSTQLGRAQIQDRPKAGPEQMKLQMRTGEWTYEGMLSDTPLGPGGKFSGKTSSKMTLDGLFMRSESEDKGNYGGKEMFYKSMGMAWFDPVTKSYLDQYFDNDGMVSKSVLTVSEHSWSSSGTATDSKGKTYKTRSVTTFAADGKTSKTKGEISIDDGKTWKPHWELSSKKVGSAQ
jgi:hypothetical protein